jgi:hypothetical protein
MKTPRDLLWDKHANAQPDLDALRRDAVSAMRPHESPPQRSLVSWLRTWRAQLALMGCAWLCVGFLTARTEPPAARSAPPSSAVYTLREHHRLVLEWTDSSLVPVARREPGKSLTAPQTQVTTNRKALS